MADLIEGHDPDRFAMAKCPGGCGATVPVVELARGSGADFYTDKAPIWCSACLKAKTTPTAAVTRRAGRVA